MRLRARERERERERERLTKISTRWAFSTYAGVAKRRGTKIGHRWRSRIARRGKHKSGSGSR